MRQRQSALLLRSATARCSRTSSCRRWGFIIVGYTWISLDPASKTMGIIWVVAGIVYCVVLHKVMKKNVDLEV